MWNPSLLFDIGNAIGVESRGVHNSQLDKSGETGGEGWPGKAHIALPAWLPPLVIDGKCLVLRVHVCGCENVCVWRGRGGEGASPCASFLPSSSSGPPRSLCCAAQAPFGTAQG